MRRSALVLSFAGILAACSSTGNPNVGDSGKLNSIVEKRTTMAEVRDLLGEPAHVSTDVGGDTIWGYRLARSTLFSDIKFTSVILQIRDGVVVSKDVSGF